MIGSWGGGAIAEGIVRRKVGRETWGVLRLCGRIEQVSGEVTW